MNFSTIQLADLPVCASLYLDVFNNPPWNESWEFDSVARRMEDCYYTPKFFGLMVKIEDEVVGFAIGYLEQWDKSQHFYLKEICVASERQRQGVGVALMNELEARLRNDGVEKLYLHTARETPAQAFYEKQGYYVSSKMIMMAKWLNPK